MNQALYAHMNNKRKRKKKKKKKKTASELSMGRLFLLSLFPKQYNNNLHDICIALGRSN
jgi:hypothetical protein